MKIETLDEVAPSEEIAAPGLQSRDRKDALIRRLALLWRKRNFLLRSIAAGMLVGIALAFLIPKKFQSTTQLMPPDSSSSSGMAMLASVAGRSNAGLAGSAADLLGLKTSGALFVGILRSETVQDRLIDRFDLKKVYGAQIEAMARRNLEENTEITEDRKSGIISISVTDRDPQRAAALASAYIDELNRVVANVSTSSAHRERMFLEQRLQSIKQDLDDSSRALSEFSSKNTAIDIPDQGRAMVTAAATLQGQLIAAESELQGLRQNYSEENDRVREVRARVGELRSQLNRMAGSSRKASGAAQSDSPYPTIRELPLLGATYSELYRKTKIEETIYESLNQEYELAKVEEAKETPSVKVLDEAKVPERKSFPPRAELIVLCVFLALMTSIVFVLAQARWAEIDAQDSGKLLVEEMLQTIKLQRRFGRSRIL